MNYKVVSSKRLIAKIFRDTKPDNGTFNMDILEWIGEALAFIGAPSSMKKTFDDIPISNFRGHLPCAMEFIGMVEYKGFPLFHGSDPRTYALPEDPDAFMNPAAHHDVASYFRTELETGNFVGFKQVADRTPRSDYYMLNPGTIITSFQEGTIRMHYMALPVDEEFFPLIPDNPVVFEAITWYVLRQMLMGGYRHPIFDYGFADAKWEKTLGQAQNDLMFPSPDKMESFKRMWVTMIPHIHTYNEFFHDR